MSTIQLYHVSAFELTELPGGGARREGAGFPPTGVSYSPTMTSNFQESGWIGSPPTALKCSVQPKEIEM